MGGWGSGRWRGHTRRPRVEDSLIFPVSGLVSAGSMGMSGTFGTCHWTAPKTGASISSLAFRYETRNSSWFLRLQYAVSTNSGMEQVSDLILLRATNQPFGGSRYWFTCPRCEARACKLYLPPGGLHFQCRRCSGVSYKSCQQSHKHDRMDALLARGCRIDVATVRRILKEATLDHKSWRRMVRRRWKKIMALERSLSQ